MRGFLLYYFCFIQC